MQLTNRVQTVNGIIEGITSPASRVRIFKPVFRTLTRE